MPRVKILGVSLNPGPFTIKEHVGIDSFHLGTFSMFTQVLVTIMAGVGSESAYAVSGFARKRNLPRLMVGACRPTLSPYSECCINKLGASHVREECVMVVPLSAHRF